MIYNGNVVIKKMYEKNNLPPIKGRKAEVTGFWNPVRVNLLLKAAVFFYKISKIAFLSAKVNAFNPEKLAYNIC